VVVGKQYKFGNIVPFNHIYDLYKFEEYVYPTDFETPEGISCPGRAKTKTFPTMPKAFAFSGEVLDYQRNTVTYVEESYDSLSKINVYRYKTGKDASSMRGVNGEVQVNDFNTGVSYVTQKQNSYCRMNALGSTPGYAFIKFLANGQVTMISPEQFIAVDTPSKYTYAGVRTTRGVLCDVWVIITDKIQGYTDRNVTAEWYFAVQSDKESWSSFETSRIPVAFKIWNTGNTDPVYALNVFYFDTKKPQVLSVNADIGDCFWNSARRRFTFDLNANNTADVYNNIEMFKYAITSAVSLSTGISALRVADIQVFKDTSVLHVSFDMLDKPNVVGDSANGTAGNDLANAVQLYNYAMTNGFFKLFVDVGTTTKTMIPIVSSAAEITPSANTSSGYGSGALAGLGVAMLIVGSAGGAGGAFFFFK